MPSQIKVDEIKNVAGQYEIKTNTFKGQTTGGSIAVQGEGSATTNLQGGLCKVWYHVRMYTPDINDSLNTSSLTDGGTGDARVSITNNLNNSIRFHNAVGISCVNDRYGSFNGSNQTTSVVCIQLYNNGGTAQDEDGKCMVTGDLA